MGLFSKKEIVPDTTPAPVTEQPAASETATPKPKKICCACPDTKKLRDSCIAERGEDHAYCQALIEAHKACLRVEGFNGFFEVCVEVLKEAFEDFNNVEEL